MKGKWAPFSVVAIVAGVAAGAFSLRHRKPVQGPPSPALVDALVLPSEVTLAGKIRAAHVVGVGAEVPGNIDAFLADVGQEVYAGQELARIGSAGLEAERADAAGAVAAAQARADTAEKTVAATQLEASRANADAQRVRSELDRAQKNYDRQKVLFAAGATPRLTYENAAREYENLQQQSAAVDKAARAAAERVQDTIKDRDNAKKILADKNDRLDGASAAVQAAVVLSPVDGLVVGRKGEAGQPAQESGKELFEIATDVFDLEVPIQPKPDVLKVIHPGQHALVIVPDLPNSGMAAQVKTIEGNQVVIGFTSSTPAIRPGMIADVRLRPE